MPLSFENFKAGIEAMEIPGEDREWLKKDDFRGVLIEMSEPASTNKKSLIAEFPSQEWIKLIIETKKAKDKNPPHNVGREGHKFYQTLNERAQFK